MARPSINEEDHSVGHQISFPPDLWAEFSAAVAATKGATRSGIIQELIKDWLRRRRERRIIDRAPELEAQVAQLTAEVEQLRQKVEGHDAPSPTARDREAMR
ncbi:MAG: hypothetical protein ACO1SX_25665 [Actinomycetota bacterium]